MNPFHDSPHSRPQPPNVHVPLHGAGPGQPHPGSRGGDDHPRPPPIVIAILPARPPLFPCGRLMITPAAAAVIPADEAASALRRHAAGDWGELSAEDWTSNDEALRDGARLLSAYQTRNKERFWIITEADRSVTTLLLPSDY